MLNVLELLAVLAVFMSTAYWVRQHWGTGVGRGGQLLKCPVCQWSGCYRYLPRDVGVPRCPGMLPGSTGKRCTAIYREGALEQPEEPHFSARRRQPQANSVVKAG